MHRDGNGILHIKHRETSLTRPYVVVRGMMCVYNKAGDMDLVHILKDFESQTEEFIFYYRGKGK